MYIIVGLEPHPRNQFDDDEYVFDQVIGVTDDHEQIKEIIDNDFKKWFANRYELTKLGEDYAIRETNSNDVVTGYPYHYRVVVEK